MSCHIYSFDVILSIRIACNVNHNKENYSNLPGIFFKTNNFCQSWETEEVESFSFYSNLNIETSLGNWCQQNDVGVRTFI